MNSKISLSMLLFLSLIISGTMFGCKVFHKSSKVAEKQTATPKTEFVYAIPHILIYKTTKDYRLNVPVILSDDKSKIVSYPHPADLFYDGKLVLPAQLHNGYLLDNRGITKNVAFLKYTYEEFSKLKQVPTLKELYKKIIDKNPLTELWDCGTKADFDNLESQLNKLIDKNQLSKKCKQIK